jgi:DNA-directed RNA polymerase sigma subunit (sigma70/sigma32)
VFCTLEEVAAELGIHREQVRIIEQRALRKCRAYCEARGLRLEDLLAA